LSFSFLYFFYIFSIIHYFAIANLWLFEYYSCLMKRETKERVISISKDILLSIGVLSLVPVAVLAGNSVQLLKPLLKTPKIKLYELNRNIKRLLERGLIEINEDKDYKFLKVTEKGKNLILKYKLESLANNNPPKWDRKYRVIIFDISETRKKIRDRLRIIVRGCGFICLQDSVWVYPYPCEEIVELLKEYLNLKREVIYMTVESIDNDSRLKKEFKLKR
jgi:predicted transcriptional regulator